MDGSRLVLMSVLMLQALQVIRRRETGACSDMEDGLGEQVELWLCHGDALKPLPPSLRAPTAECHDAAAACLVGGNRA